MLGMNHPEYLVLDHGSVKLHSVFLTEDDIVDIARLSTNKMGNKHRKNEDLIRYLMLNDHSSPFGFPEIVLLVKAPKFVKEQWTRHRSSWWESKNEFCTSLTTDHTASAYHDQQEFSGRYAMYEPAFYLPPEDSITEADALNKQSRGTTRVDNSSEVHERMAAEQRILNDNYRFYLNSKVAREIARINMPLSTYVDFYWKQDLWNLLHFLVLRLSPHAQWELRAYAEAIEDIVKKHFPLTHKAWKEKMDLVKLNRRDMEEVKQLLEGKRISPELAIKMGIEAKE